LKKGIHPNYVDCTITCACGNVFQTRSTIPKIHVEICSACHPFYTGKQKLVDTAGRIERYRKRYAKMETAPKADAKKEPAPKAEKVRAPKAEKVTAPRVEKEPTPKAEIEPLPKPEN
jgi:large subunit ribosomal protein L31